MGALLRRRQPGRGSVLEPPDRVSDHSCEFVECSRDGQPGERVDAEFVVAVAEVLHERVAPNHD